MKSHWIPDVRPVDLRNDDWPEFRMFVRYLRNDDWPNKSPASMLMRNLRRAGESHTRSSHAVHHQTGCKDRAQ